MKRLFWHAAVAAFIAATAAGLSADPPQAAQSKLAHKNAAGKLAYTPYTPQGDVIPDFSTAGYHGGNNVLPAAVPVRETLAPVAGETDDTLRIQAALDRVARLPVGKNGFRGAVLLDKGTFRVSDTLNITTSGVVLRGEGSGETGGTTLRATGRKPYSLVVVSGGENEPTKNGTYKNVAAPYVPVGAKTIPLESTNGFKMGDTVTLRRKSNQAWIHALGMDKIAPRASDPTSTKQWSPFDLNFYRTITNVGEKSVTLDAPLMCAINEKWGGGAVLARTDTRIQNVGIENLRAVSEFDPKITATESSDKPYPSDENHAEYIVRFERVKNAWAKNLSARYLAQGVAFMNRDAQCVTIADCRAVDMVSIITGGRRYPYNISGQQCLVVRCYSRDARHAFVVGGGQVCGPNVFLDCVAENNHATSEPHQRWSVGGLYDNVNADMAFQDRQWMGSGHGWAGANYVVWNSRGSVVCQQPPTAQNFCIGFVGKKAKGAFARPDGWWESVGVPVTPRSLYQAQRADRLRIKAAAVR